jgi:hypothetical protein
MEGGMMAVSKWKRKENEEERPEFDNFGGND